MMINKHTTRPVLLAAATVMGLGLAGPAHAGPTVTFDFTQDIGNNPLSTVDGVHDGSDAVFTSSGFSMIVSGWSLSDSTISESAVVQERTNNTQDGIGVLSDGAAGSAGDEVDNGNADGDGPFEFMLFTLDGGKQFDAISVRIGDVANDGDQNFEIFVGQQSAFLSSGAPTSFPDMGGLTLLSGTSTPGTRLIDFAIDPVLGGDLLAIGVNRDRGATVDFQVTSATVQVPVPATLGLLGLGLAGLGVASHRRRRA